MSEGKKKARSAKNKGARGEHMACVLLSNWAKEVGVALNVERRLDQARGGACDLQGVPGLAIEVKFQESLHVNSWWDQTLRNAKKVQGRPFLMYKQARKPWKFRILLHINTNTTPVWLPVDLEEDVVKVWFKQYIKDLYYAYPKG